MTLKTSPKPSPEVLYMQQAYSILYQIESSLKRYAEKSLINQYGPYWQQVLAEPRSLSASYFCEVVRFYGKYAPLNHIFSPEETKLLYSLQKIRNKIAHMQVISTHEFNVLSECHDLVQSCLAFKI